jgi:integrase
MSRLSKTPRLYLKRRKPPRSDVWIIRDGAARVGTGCDTSNRRGAEEALGRYIANKYAPPDSLAASELFIDEVVAGYLKDYAVHSPSRTFLFDTARPILAWWGGKKLSEVNRSNCRRFVEWRTTQMYRGRQISDQTARHNLKTLRAAINWYHSEHGPLPSVPKVTLPGMAPQRLDYWLTRSEVAARVKAACKSARTRHVARAILIGVYTGTRPGAIFALKWLASPVDGWFDVDNGVLHRKGVKARQSRKRQPPARIHAKLLPHLRRWRKMDLALGITSVVHYQGEEIAKLRRSWGSVARLGGATRKDGPHIMRHTAATWQMLAGTDIYQAAGYLGMSPETLWRVYGHHHPDFQADAAKATGKRRPGVVSSAGSG